MLKPLESINVDYLCYSLMFYDVSNIVKGSTRLKLNQTDMRKMLIPLVSLEEQKEIASTLTEIDSLIDLGKKQLELFDELIKSRFIEMFGDDKYKKVTMKEITLIITDGTHQPPKFEKTGIPFIFVSNITSNELTYNAEKFISEETYQELYKRTPIEKGDCLLSSVGSYGHCAIVKSDKKFLFQRHIAYLKPNKTFINSIYMQNAILSEKIQWQIENAVKGIAQKTLNLSEVKKLEVPLPPLTLQNQFAAFVEEVEQTKIPLNKSIEWLLTLKSSLMQQYFS